MYHHHPYSGYFASKNAYEIIAQKWYWENMKDIINAVKHCDRCQCFGKSIIHEQLHPIPITLKPFSQVSLDIKHCNPSRLGNQYIIVAINFFMKWLKCHAL